MKTLTAIHQQAPNAKIVLMGYPRLFEKDGQCAGAAGIGTEEGPWLNEMADNLAEEMRGAAGDTGSYAVFADPRAAFAGQAVCGDPETIHWHRPHRPFQGRHHSTRAVDEVVPPKGRRNSQLHQGI
ncbi:hypothetical protein ACFWMU_18055 [Streptomyces sp. NPDC058357]|uniref:hypothetical protein n=1 Tax=Streptomyces sp. NPDC058357 TaxID=3346456 RepID=UPI003658E4AC